MLNMMRQSINTFILQLSSNASNADERRKIERLKLTSGSEHVSFCSFSHMLTDASSCSRWKLSHAYMQLSPLLKASIRSGPLVQKRKSMCVSNTLSMLHAIKSRNTCHPLIVGLSSSLVTLKCMNNQCCHHQNHLKGSTRPQNLYGWQDGRGSFCIFAL